MKAISFDFWGTLCKSNPVFRERQFELVREYDSSITLEIWNERKAHVKALANSLAETKGIQVSRLDMYHILLPNCSMRLIEEFINYSDEIFLYHQPINLEASESIQKLKDLGYRIYVSSNTVLINGDTLSRVIYEKFGIIKSNCKFSDEVDAAKPNKAMFKFPIKPSFHIGDNSITDGSCTNFDIRFIKVDERLNNNFSNIFNIIDA